MKQWLAFGILGLIWGSSFLLIKIAVEDLGTLPLVAIRIGLAGLLMLVYLGVSGRRLPASRTDIFSLLVVSLFNIVVPFTLITGAEERIDSSVATVLNSSVPLFSLVLAHFALKDEKLNRTKVFGLLIGYVGIVVLTSRGLNDATNNPLSGQLMMIGATISYAGAIVFMRARLRHIEPITTAGITLVMAACFIVPLTLLVGNLPSPDGIEAQAWLSVLVLGVVNTVIAYFLFYYLIGEWGARATMVTYTFPPVGITLGALFLDEPIDARLILGAILILSGIVAVNYKPRRLRGNTPPAAVPVTTKTSKIV